MPDYNEHSDQAGVRATNQTLRQLRDLLEQLKAATGGGDATEGTLALVRAAAEALAAGRGSAATAAIEVGTSETTLATITPGTGVERITVDVANAAGGEALNSFKVYARAHAEADWVEHALTDTQVVAGYDTDLSTLAANANAQLVLNARGWQAIKFTATTASGTADVTTRYTAA